MAVFGEDDSSITIFISGGTTIVNCSVVAGVDVAVRARHAPQRFLTRGAGGAGLPGNIGAGVWRIFMSRVARA